MVSIWCAQGDRASACQVLEDGTIAVPQALPIAVCYAFNPEESAACQQGPLVSDDGNYVVTTLGDFGEHAGDYPPLFYEAMSVFVGPDIERSILTMRLVNVLILTVMLATVYAASSSRVRQALVITTAVTIVPLGAFLVPSINPSGWTITSAFTLFFAVFGYVRARSRSSLVVLGIASVIGLALGAGSRADGSMYAAISVGAATLLALRSFRPTRATMLRLVLPVLLIVVAAATFLNVGSSAVSAPAQETDGWQAVLVFFDIFRYIPGALGTHELGWGDTTLPSIVWVLACMACAGAVFAGVATLARRRLIVLLLVAGSLILIPTYIAATSWTPGASLQSRYIYPLLIATVAVATLVTERRGISLTAPQRWLTVGLVSIANAVAIYTNLRRYVTGVDVQTLRLTPGEWWWSGAVVSSEMVALVGAVSLPVALVMVTRVLVGPIDAEPGCRAELIEPPQSRRDSPVGTEGVGVAGYPEEPDETRPRHIQILSPS